ncbi:MAG: 50S ribosomal protein L29 [Gammaproteobacteria bacterium]
MIASELRDKTLEALDAFVIEQLQALCKLRMEKHSGQTVEGHKARQIRRAIARAKTIKHEKMRGENNG